MVKNLIIEAQYIYREDGTLLHCLNCLNNFFTLVISVNFKLMENAESNGIIKKWLRLKECSG